MKKLLKFILYFVLFVLIVLFTAPVLFKGKIIKIAKDQINNSINAKAEFKDLNLSFFKNFPYLNAGIKDLTVTGIDDFEGDTLIHIGSIDIAIEVISAIKMENIEIKKIAINDPTINALVLEDGKANWDIAKETEEPSLEDTDTNASGFDANIALKSFKISQANIYYTDISSDLSASLEDFNFELSGDFSQDYSSLIINSNTDKVNVLMSGIKYLSDVVLNIHLDIDANLKDMQFKLMENSLALNDLILTLDGSIEMPDTTNILVDLNYGTNDAEFKSLLSLVPAIYKRDFEELKTQGKVSLKGGVKGTVNDTEMPDVNGKLQIKNAQFSYPDLPKTANNINIDVDYFYDGNQMDNTTVDVNKFHVEFGGNPIDLVLNLKTPISDPFINSQMKANIDLASFADIIPLEDTEIKGEIISNLDVMGNLSLIENEKYEEFKAVGGIKITDFYFNSPDVPKALGIEEADVTYSPKHLEILKFKAYMGESDFAFNGKVTNFLPFIFKDETIYGQLNFSSSNINLNELMPTEDSETEVNESNDTSNIEVIGIPSNIDFTLKSTIANLLYEDFEMQNLVGNIYIKDSKVIMEKLSMDALSGELLVSGVYNTQDIDNPLVDFNFQANEIDISTAFESFAVLGKIAPIVSKATGKVSLGMEYSSFLSNTMAPILKSIVGGGNMTSEKISLNGSNAFSAIGEQLNLDEFKELILQDLDLDFEILAGKLLVSPFETNMGETNLLIAGQQSFENTMDYDINLSAPKSLFGSSNTSLNSIYNNSTLKGLDLANSDNVNLLVKLTGKMSNPTVKIDPVAGLKETTEAVKEELKANAKEAIDTKKAEAKAEAKKEADKIMAEAQKNADEVKKQGKIAANKVREEANKNAAKMVDEAKNVLLKKAAEIGAKEVKAEGEKKATLIEKESEAKAQKIIDTAQNKADKLLN